VYKVRHVPGQGEPRHGKDDDGLETGVDMVADRAVQLDLVLGHDQRDRPLGQRRLAL